MKKLLSMLLVLMMLILPAASLAEGDAWADAARIETTVTLHDLNTNMLLMLGLSDEIATAVKDTLDSLLITTYQQAQQYGYNVALGKTTLLSTDCQTTDTSVVYLASNLLGGTVSLDLEKDLEKVTEMLIRAVCKMQGMSDEEIETGLANIKEELQSLTSSFASAPTADFNAIISDIMNADWEETGAIIDEILESCEFAEVTEQPDGCDPVKQMITLTITKEQLTNLLQAIVNELKEMPSLKAYIAETNAYLTTIDKNATLDSNLTVNADSVQVVLYLDGNASIAKAHADMVITEEDNDTEKLTFDFSRLTNDDATKYTVVTVVDEEERVTVETTLKADSLAVTTLIEEEEDGAYESLLRLDLNWMADSMNALLTVYSGGSAVTFGLAITTEETISDAKATKTTNIALQFVGMDVLTITAETVTCDAQAPLSDGDVTDLAAMDDTAFETWLSGVMTNVNNMPMRWMLALPDSALTLLMGTGN